MRNLDSDITFFTSSMGNGGAQRTMGNLARGFAERNYSVDLLLIDARGPYLKDIPQSVNVIDLDSDRTLTSILPLVNYLNINEPDVFFSTMEYLNIASLLVAELSRTQTRIAIRASTIPAEQNTTGMKSRIQYRLARTLYPKADYLFALSKSVKREMVNYYGLDPELISAVYNPIAVKDIQQQANEKPDREVLRTDSEILLNVGRLSEEKDISTTIRAFSRLTESRDVELVILGKGDQKQELKQLTADLDVAEQVHFFGFVDNPFAYMKAADVFVLSSKWEGFGHVLVEAMACGTPIVATDCPGGPSEILRNGKYGELVPVGDDMTLSLAIERTLQDPLKQKVLINRAMDFNYKEITSQYEEKLFGDELE